MKNLEFKLNIFNLTNLVVPFFIKKLELKLYMNEEVLYAPDRWHSVDGIQVFTKGEKNKLLGIHPEWLKLNFNVEHLSLPLGVGNSHLHIQDYIPDSVINLYMNCGPVLNLNLCNLKMLTLTNLEHYKRPSAYFIKAFAKMPKLESLITENYFYYDKYFFIHLPKTLKILGILISLPSEELRQIKSIEPFDDCLAEITIPLEELVLIGDLNPVIKGQFLKVIPGEKLTALSLSCCREVSNENLLELTRGRFPHLIRLNLNFNRNIDDSFPFDQMKLEFIDLTWCDKFNGHGLDKLNFEKLKQLSIEYSKILSNKKALKLYSAREGPFTNSIDLWID